MSTTTTGTTGFSTLVQEFIMAQTEAELRANLVHVAPGNYIPGRFDKGTDTIRVARYADLAAVTTALTEGTPPTGQALSIDSESFSATQIGGTIELTDLAALESPHDLFAIAAERTGRQAALSIDELARQTIAAGTEVRYSGTATSRLTVAGSAVLNGAEVRKTVAWLESKDVPRFPDGFFRAVIHPRAAYDLKSDTATGGWIDTLRYTDNRPLLANEIGTYGGVRFQVSTRATTFATAGASSVDVLSSVFFGPGFLYVGDLQTLTARFVPPGGDHTDPLGQVAITGWKIAFGTMLATKQIKYVRVEHGGSIILSTDK